MSVQAPEKPEVRNRTESLPDVPDVAQEDGLRIAREAFLRGLWRFCAQALLGLTAVTLLFFAARWSFTELKTLPQEAPKLVPQQLKDLAKYLFTPELPKVDASVVEKAQSAPEVKPRAVPRAKLIIARRKSAVHKPFARRSYNQDYFGFSDPAGGRVSYTDGTVTEYSWK